MSGVYSNAAAGSSDEPRRGFHGIVSWAIPRAMKSISCIRGDEASGHFPVEIEKRVVLNREG